MKMMVRCPSCKADIKADLHPFEVKSVTCGCGCEFAVDDKMLDDCLRTHITTLHMLAIKEYRDDAVMKRRINRKINDCRDMRQLLKNNGDTTC